MKNPVHLKLEAVLVLSTFTQFQQMVIHSVFLCKKQNSPTLSVSHVVVCDVAKEGCVLSFKDLGQTSIKKKKTQGGAGVAQS